MEQQISFFESALQENGYRLTPARRAVMEALLVTGGHLSADALVAVVHQNAAQIGRMTVYRTLDLLSELGLIRPIYQGTGAAHYILLDSGHHHHLVCAVCDMVIEFDECVLADIEQMIGERFQFQVQGHVVEFYGRCQQCQSSS